MRRFRWNACQPQLNKLRTDCVDSGDGVQHPNPHNRQALCQAEFAQLLNNQLTDFAGLGMTAQGLFGIHQVTVDRYFKNTTDTRNHIPLADVNLDFTFSQDFLRQTDGTGRVISSRAIFKCDIQKGLLHDEFPFCDCTTIQRHVGNFRSACLRMRKT